MKAQSTLVVLDAANIATIVRGAVKIQRVQSALDHFEELGIRCIAFAPGYWIKGRALTPRGKHLSGENELDQNTDIAALQQLVQEEKVVLTPPQAHDDLFIIDYAMKHNGYVVTNDMFRDHVAHKLEFHGKELTEAWVKAQCITFTFVGTEFLPCSQHMQPLLRSKHSQSRQSPTHRSSNNAAKAPELQPRAQTNYSVHLNTKLSPKESKPRTTKLTINTTMASGQKDSEVQKDFEAEVQDSLQNASNNIPTRAKTPKQPTASKQVCCQPEISPIAKTSLKAKTPRAKASTPSYKEVKESKVVEGTNSTKELVSMPQEPCTKKNVGKEWDILQRIIAKQHGPPSPKNQEPEEELSCMDDALDQSQTASTQPHRRRHRRRTNQKKSALIYRVRATGDAEATPET